MLHPHAVLKHGDKGEVIRKIRGEENLLPEFMKELDIFLKEKRGE